MQKPFAITRGGRLLPIKIRLSVALIDRVIADDYAHVQSAIFFTVAGFVRQRSIVKRYEYNMVPIDDIISDCSL